MSSAELLHLRVVEPARGLVEQQQPRVRHQRARELDALLQAVGGRLAGDSARGDRPTYSRVSRAC